MPEEEARYHMKRCIDSGLWLPDAKLKEKEKEQTAGEPSTAEPTPDPE